MFQARVSALNGKIGKGEGREKSKMRSLTVGYINLEVECVPLWTAAWRSKSM